LYNFTVFEYAPGITRRIGGIFRSSGRLFWPCWYFLSYFLVWLLFQSRKNNAKYILVAIAALQLYDLSPTIRQSHENVERWSKTSYQSAFKSEAWNTLFERYGNVFIVGDFLANSKMYEDLWYMIPARRIQVNDGYFALRNQSMREAKSEENWLKSGVISARLPDNTIFIFVSQSIAESYLKHAPLLSGHVKELDGIHYLLWDQSLVEGDNLSGLILKWNACDLPAVSANARVNKEACEVESLANRSGLVTNGPHIWLPQGKYSFEIEYAGVLSTSATDVGGWDVTVSYGEVVLEKGVLPSTNGNRGMLRGTFTLPPKYVREFVEIRTFVQPDAKLTIHGIELKRIE
jgi:hypothetical protein